MKAAFTTWENRIAPVFDVSRQIHLVEVERGRIVGEAEEALTEEMSVQKALRLAELGVDTLVCGAISNTMLDMVAAYGIRVIPFVSGDLREVIEAWMNKGLERDLFAMPGCCGARRRLRQSKGSNRGRRTMNGSGRGGRRAGAGQGKGQGGRSQTGGGRGRMGGPSAGGPGGNCVCKECGHQEPHERGTPCTQRQCPKCGAAMKRQ